MSHPDPYLDSGLKSGKLCQEEGALPLHTLSTPPLSSHRRPQSRHRLPQVLVLFLKRLRLYIDGKALSSAYDKLVLIPVAGKFTQFGRSSLLTASKHRRSTVPWSCAELPKTWERVDSLPPLPLLPLDSELLHGAKLLHLFGQRPHLVLQGVNGSR